VERAPSPAPDPLVRPFEACSNAETMADEGVGPYPEASRGTAPPWHKGPHPGLASGRVAACLPDVRGESGFHPAENRGATILPYQPPHA
jgi:hypothetical protein